MGEYADDFTDASFYDEHIREDVDPEFAAHRWGEDGPTDGGYVTRKRKKPIKTCRYCGQENLRWGKKAMQYRLVDTEGKTHNCSNYKNRNRLKTNVK